MRNHMHPLALPTHQDEIAPGRFRHFLAAAPKGATYIYHVGFLLQDRGIGPDDDPGPLPHKMGDIARKSYEAGDVVLVQKRRKEGQFIYIAVHR